MNPVFYNCLFDICISVLSKAGIDDASADDLARKITQSFCDSFCGWVFRIPGLKRQKKLERDANIKADYRYMSVNDLMRKYRVSRRVVTNAIKADA